MVLFAIAQTHVSSAQNYNVVWDFGPPETYDGSAPEGQVAIDPVGNIYGTTNGGGVFGGAYGYGSVFELSPPANGAAWTENVIYSFTGPNIPRAVSARVVSH